MKTWRERTIEAEARGSFNDEDQRMICNVEGCVLWEAGRAFDVKYPYHYAVVHLDPRGSTVDEQMLRLELRFMTAMDENDFAEAHRVLDELDDRILKHKRELA